MRTKLIFFAGLFIAAGCSTVAGIEDLAYEEPTPTTGTSMTEPPPGTSGEAGPAPAPPAGMDGAAADSSTVPLDAGLDTSVAVDAADAAVVVVDPPDPDPDPDPNPGPGPGAGAGCTQQDFAANDRRAMNASRTIVLVPAVPGVPAAYQPKCMLVRPGQAVTWQGDFVTEPLQPRSQMPPSPITPVAAGNTATFTFAQKGRYRYGSAATPTLRGAIDVRH